MAASFCHKPERKTYIFYVHFFVRLGYLQNIHALEDNGFFLRLDLTHSPLLRCSPLA